MAATGIPGAGRAACCGGPGSRAGSRTSWSTATPASRPAPGRPALPRSRADRGRRRGHRDPATAAGPRPARRPGRGSTRRPRRPGTPSCSRPPRRAFDGGRTEAAERTWHQARTAWPPVWAASCAAPRLLQHKGVTRFSRSSHSAGSWPRPGITPGRTASRARPSTTSFLRT
jgi:hypothetical protein